MMKKIAPWISIVILLVVIFYPYYASQAALVTCGIGENKDVRCTLCHLVAGFKTLVDFLVGMLAIVFLFSVAIAGLMYTISTGNETMINSSKGFLKAAFIGLVVTLGAWLIVNVVILTVLPARPDLGVGVSKWNDFQCL
jgi:hypothetical protein